MSEAGHNIQSNFGVAIVKRYLNCVSWNPATTKRHSHLLVTPLEFILCLRVWLEIAWCPRFLYAAFLLSTLFLFISRYLMMIYVRIHFIRRSLHHSAHKHGQKYKHKHALHPKIQIQQQDLQTRAGGRTMGRRVRTNIHTKTQTLTNTLCLCGVFIYYIFYTNRACLHIHGVCVCASCTK